MILTAIRNLFSRSTKIKLIVVLAGYILVSLFDMLGIVALVPLMSLLTMPSTSKGFTGVSNVFWQLLGKPDTATYALTIAVIVALAFTLKAIFGITFRWWSLRFLSKQQTQTAVQLFRAYLEAPYELHRRTSANRIMHSVAWVTMSVFQGVNSGISFLGEMFTVLTVVITLFILNPAIALIVVVLFAGVGGIFQLSIRRRSKNASKAAQLQQERSTKAILHGLGGVKEIIIRNNPGPFLNAFEHAELLKNSATRSKQLFSELPKYFLEVLLVGGIALISAYLFGTGGSLQMLSTLAIFGAAGFRLLPSITRMLASLNGVLHTQPAFEKLTTDFAQLAKEKRNPGTPGLVKYHGDIKLSNVSYCYEPDVPVLHDINLTVPAGSTLALVGASGAGKSTLVDLLLGLQAPTTGQITCGSIDIHKNLIDWQSQVGLVPQDVFLLDASLRENIVFDVAEKDIDEEWLKETVRLARLTELVESTPEGLNLMVGDRGVRISGGQKQRIAIARALYKKPSILILDEATSALDNETERQITQTIEGLAGEITVIVVAHRLSTVKGCDQFLVLNQGKAEALGTLQQVKKSSKTFANLAKLASLEV